MKHLYYLAPTIVIFVVLVACGNPTASTQLADASTLTSTSTAQTKLTLDPTTMPSPSSTHTTLPRNTPTSIPTQTSTHTPTSTPSAIPEPTSTLTATPIPLQPTEPATPASQPTATTVTPSTRTVRIGLHGRNDLYFDELDYQLIREAKIETMKMMSLTDPSVFARIKQENPEIEFIVRLYDDRINASGHPTPQEYAAKMGPIMEQLQPYVVKFELGNEPNHLHRYEGWGSEDADAQSFNSWFLEVYTLLKAAYPWAELGYPALATPDSYHRDKAWLSLTVEAINQADWLGVHCYWQTQPDQTSTMFDEDRGLCFKYYHALFPDKPLEITEFDNDNVIWDVPANSPEEIAQQYVTYYQELFKYPYIRSASSFIMSSPDPRWDYFVWRSEGGEFKPVVTQVGEMPRLPLAE
ncbi:MAG: hypothetical protein AAF485_07410 [Chloroflexota bacterium]